MVQLKLQSPKLNIAVHEKNISYKRYHTLTLSRECFKNSVGDLSSQWFEGKGDKSVRITTSRLERDLREVAKRLGIAFVTGINPYVGRNGQNRFRGIQNVHEEIIDKYPSIRYVVGSDGRHSAVRKQLFQIPDDVSLLPGE